MNIFECSGVVEGVIESDNTGPSSLTLIDLFSFPLLLLAGCNQRRYTIHFFMILCCFSFLPEAMTPLINLRRMEIDAKGIPSTLLFPLTHLLMVFLSEREFFQLILQMPFNWFSFSHFHCKIMFLFNHNECKRMIHEKLHYRRGIHRYSRFI